MQKILIFKCDERNTIETVFKFYDTTEWKCCLGPGLYSVMEYINIVAEFAIYNNKNFFLFPVNISLVNPYFQPSKRKTLRDYEYISKATMPLSMSYDFKGPIVTFKYCCFSTGYYSSDFWFDYSYSRLYLGIGNVSNVGDVFMCNNFNPNQVREKGFGAFLLQYDGICMAVGLSQMMPNALNYQDALRIHADYIPVLSIDNNFFSSPFFKQHVCFYSTYIFFLVPKMDVMFRLTLNFHHFGYISFFRRFKIRGFSDQLEIRHVIDIFLNFRLMFNYIFNTKLFIFEYIRPFIFIKSIFGDFRVFFALVFTYYGFCFQIMLNTKGTIDFKIYVDTKFKYDADNTRSFTFS